MTQDSPPRGPRWRLHAIVFAALMLVGATPHGFEPITAEVDPSWIAGLHEAFASGKRFGVELLFTYGPWGFAAEPLAYVPTMPWVACYQVCLRFLTAGAFAALACGPARSLLMLATALIAGQLLGPEPGIVACWLWILCEAREDRIGSGFAGAAVGLWALGKGTHLWLGLALAIAMTVRHGRRRTIPIGSLMFGVAWTNGWFTAGQRAGDIWAYLSGSIEIVRGYTEAMSRWTPYDWLTPGYLLGAILIAFALKRRFAPFVFWAALFIGVAIFKIEFVRPGPDRAAKALATVVAMGLASAAADRAAMNGWMRAGLLVVLFTGIFLPPEYRWDGSVVRNARRFDPLLGEWRIAFADQSARKRWAATQRQPEMLHDSPRAGSVDVVPHFQAIAVAAGWKYRPRPVFQSYHAYTTRLAAMNAAFYASDAAPDEILVGVAPIDGRFAPTDDGPCWREWVRRYRIAGDLGLLIRLAKRKAPKRLSQHLIAESSHAFGDAWSLPEFNAAHAFLWVEMEFDETLLHRAALLLYKSVRPKISIDGGPARQLVPGLARAGFVVSPIVDSVDGMRRFMDREPLPPARSVRIDAPASLFGDSYRVRLYQINVE